MLFVDPVWDSDRKRNETALRDPVWFADMSSGRSSPASSLKKQKSSGLLRSPSPTSALPLKKKKSGDVKFGGDSNVTDGSANPLHGKDSNSNISDASKGSVHIKFRQSVNFGDGRTKQSAAAGIQAKVRA